MKRSITAFAIVLGWVCAAYAAAPGTLTSLRAIHALTNDQAKQNIPVAFEATVTYFRGHEKTLFVQDDDVAIFVLVTTNANLIPGDRVLIKGKTRESFNPIVASSDITVLGHGALPKSVPVRYDDLVHERYDCKRVTVRAVVRSADVVSASAHSAMLEMLADGGDLEVNLDSGDADALKDLLDAEVEVTGAASGKFDGKMQQTGTLLHVSSMAGIKVLARATASPWSLPITPMGEILTDYHINNLTQRVRVQGTVTYYQPGSALVLQNGSRSLWVITQTRNELRIGDIVDATGIPGVHDGFLALTESEVQDSQVWAPVTPQPSNWSYLAQSFNIFDLVSIEGQVVTEVRETAQDDYVLVADGHQFTAIYRHPPADGSTPVLPMKNIPPGSKVRVVGICILEDSNPFNALVPFDILLRFPDDITVVANPSWLNIRNLLILVGLLIAIVIAVGLRGWALERRVRRQTAAMAALERRRSRILEDINGARPLAEILEEIAELISFTLHGAPCWCQIADGARLGDEPPQPSTLRIVHAEIPARSGPPLGTIFAALDPLSQPSAADSEALAIGAGLATLAIETRRLYTDLRRRSEFDLLTDILNRFSLEKHLDARIDDARQNAAIFGLIYIDLDDFKQVNDLYGHHAGDLYLQEASLRMKRQLRPQDMLARLGGDEFAVLIPTAHCRAEVNEIALRLERCFDDPFSVEGHRLFGAASVGIALYPENGATKDSLLNAADAAMYLAKNTKKKAAAMGSGHAMA